MNLKLVLAAVAFLSQPFFFGEAMKIYFVNMKCVGNEKFVYPNLTCYARSQNRSFSALNGYVMPKQPVYQIWVAAENSICDFYFTTFVIIGSIFGWVPVWNDLSGNFQEATSRVLRYDERYGKDAPRFLLVSETVQSEHPTPCPRLSLYRKSLLFAPKAFKFIQVFYRNSPYTTSRCELTYCQQFSQQADTDPNLLQQIVRKNQSWTWRQSSTLNRLT